MSVDANELRRAMRNWASGVTVVSSLHEGVRHGMTVSSFTSLSLSPPLVMVSLETATRTHELVRKAGFFGVTVLEAGQRHIADQFADPNSESGCRFLNLETHTLRTGAPFIAGGIACFDCQVVSRHPAGTHSIFIGEVLATTRSAAGEPLLYFRREYRSILPSSKTE